MVGYNPNRNQIAFWEEIYSHIGKDDKAELIILGDFNIAMNINLDRSKIGTLGALVQFCEYMEKVKVKMYGRRIMQKKGIILIIRPAIRHTPEHT